MTTTVPLTPVMPGAVPTVTIPLDLLRALVAVVMTDEKTSALSYRAWREQALRRAADGSLQRGAVLMVDVDRFAAVNARHGHLGADRVLSGIADTLATVVGPGGAVGRFGGDEFVALVPVEDITDARRLARDARRAVADLYVPVEAPNGARMISGITVSVGAAVGEGVPLDLTLLWSLADRALHAAKRAGRDRVRVVDARGYTRQR